jgi:hypothetical protein
MKIFFRVLGAKGVSRGPKRAEPGAIGRSDDQEKVNKNNILPSLRRQAA